MLADLIVAGLAILCFMGIAVAVSALEIQRPDPFHDSLRERHMERLRARKSRHMERLRARKSRHIERLRARKSRHMERLRARKSR